MWIKVFTALLGITMSAAYFPQAYRIFKTKSSRDVSILSFSIFAGGTLIWTLYGFYIQDLVVILSFIVGVVGSWSVLGLALFYRKKTPPISGEVSDK